MLQKSEPWAVALSDDLTGTLGLSILIANENIPVRALTNVRENYDPSDDAGRTVVINTNSRNLSEMEAKAAVTSMIRRFPPTTTIVKRFDTTLRGHLGAELAAIMEHRPQAAAIIVPSYPASGRLCIGGYQQINGVPVERTEATKDSRWPILNSFVPDYFPSTAVDHIPLSEVGAGLESLRSRLRALMQPGAVVVVDAYSDGDIAMIARATRSIDRELIFVSPGAFIGVALGIRYRQEDHRIVVAAIGSSTEQTQQQVSALEERYAVQYLELPISVIAEDNEDKVVQEFLKGWDPRKTEILVIRPERERANTSLQPRIVSAIARTIQTVLSSTQFETAGLILSGGETAMTVLDQLGAYNIRPEVEFGSLVMGGILLDGSLPGLKIVTKGGMVGDRSILLKSMTWFLRRIDHEK